MKENGKVSVIYSWPVIILALCIFWPVGIFLIIKRTTIDKKFALGVGKIIGILGICSYALAILFILAFLFNGFESYNIGCTIFFGIAGFVLCKLAKNIRSDADSVKQYLAIVVNGNIRQLDSIAATTGKSYDVVKKDIQKMIQKGYLKNAYIDEGIREIVLPEVKPAGTSPANYGTATAVEKKPATKIVACPCCGANNTITGAGGECEYCGSPLQ